MSMCLFSYSLRLVIVTSLSLLVCECFRNSPHWKNSLIYRKSYESTQLTTLVYSRALTSTPNTAGSDALGFSSNLSTKRFQLETQVIFGSNAIEHGINLIEEKTRNILLLSGWNNARLDPVLWELEPRGFQLHVCSISEEPTCENILQIIAAALQCNCGAIIAMGCGSVLDSAKLATMLINSHEDIESLANMSPIGLEEYLVCYNEREYHKPDLCRVLLVTVPALPSMGAELSDIVALKKIIWQPNAVQNKDEMDNSAYSVAPLLLVDEEQLIGAIPQQESVYVAQPKNRDICKMYVRAVNPDLSLVQPSLTYRAPMELVHDRLIALLATSIDIILSDPGKVIATVFS